MPFLVRFPVDAFVAKKTPQHFPHTRMALLEAQWSVVKWFRSSAVLKACTGLNLQREESTSSACQRFCCEKLYATVLVIKVQGLECYLLLMQEILYVVIRLHYLGFKWMCRAVGSVVII